MPLEPLHFPILKKVVPPTLLRNQTPVLNQLPHPHCRYPEDLSGLSRRDQAHLAQSCTPIHTINQSYSNQQPPKFLTSWPHRHSRASARGSGRGSGLA